MRGGLARLAGEPLVGVAVLLFAGITLLRVFVEDPAEAAGTLYVLPICLIAVRGGLRGAMIAAGAALVAYVGLNQLTGHDVGLLGNAIRVTLFAGSAALVGGFAERARRADRAASARFATMLDSTHEAYIAMNREGRVTAWNPEAARLFGWEASEALGRKVEETVVPERLRDDHRAGLARYLRTGEGPVLGTRLELPALRRDGSELPVELTITAIGTEGDQSFHAFLHDISDRRRREESQRQLAAMVESSGDAILSEALDGTITSWNPGAERIYGYTATEAIGRHASLIVPEGFRTEFAQVRRDVAAGESHDEVETRGLRKDGREIDVSLTVSPILDAESTIVGATVIGRDVSARRAAEQEAERLKSEFFALVSHELRTPLTSILGYSDVIEEEEAENLSEQGRRFLGVIQRNTRRLDRLVRDLLLVAQVEAGTFAVEQDTVDLGEVARDGVEELRPAAQEAGVELELELAPPPPFVGDPLRLGQVLDNLVSNSIKFTPAGGHIKVSIGRDGERARIEVTDTGAGIDPEEMKHLFDRFYRAGAANVGQIKGVGLGLAITRAIVEGHGGEIVVESEGGRGSTFRVLVPLAGAEAEAGEGEGAAPAPEEAW